jgi:hypothetical protein
MFENCYVNIILNIEILSVVIDYNLKVNICYKNNKITKTGFLLRFRFADFVLLLLFVIYLANLSQMWRNDV